MATRIPLVLVNGQIQQLQPGDTLAFLADLWRAILNGDLDGGSASATGAGIIDGGTA